MDIYQQYIFKSKYAIWNWDRKRRESWDEAVSRYITFLADHAKKNHNYEIPQETIEEITSAISNHEVVGSMRLLRTAGKAAERCNVCTYNCSFDPIETAIDFAEIFYILLSGTGAGFSVEGSGRSFKIPRSFIGSSGEYTVQDSKEGWADSIKYVIETLSKGIIPKINYSLIRPEGSILKTFGGRASGAAPLKKSLDFVIELYQNHRGGYLTPAEISDIVCIISEAVQVGGTRRSALIVLYDKYDTSMRTYKTGNWYQITPWRSMANISAVHEYTPTVEEFCMDWHNLIASKSGEPGIYNRDSAIRKLESIGRSTQDTEKLGLNPCAEILLKPRQFCNLSEVIVRSTDTELDLERKVKIAAILGTLQSSLTKFNYLRPKWKENAETERLLGVSFTGIYNNPLMYDHHDRELPYRLKYFREVARKVNVEWAARLGINASAAVTCVKPSGNTSALTNTCNGLHPWHSKYYIKHTRLSNHDPLCKFLKDQGFLWEKSVRDPNDSMFIFAFKAPEGALTKVDITAEDHFSLWLLYRKHYCDHNPSVTISVKDEEWLTLGGTVHNNWDEVGGVTFFPHWEESTIYTQLPFKTVTKEEYGAILAKYPKNVDWEGLKHYEKEDYTTSGREYACIGGMCEI